MIHRRKFLTGLASLIAAPAVVRASSLMPVKALRPAPAMEINALLRLRLEECYAVTRQNMCTMLYSNPEFTPVEFTGFASRQEFPYTQWATELVFDK